MFNFSIDRRVIYIIIAIMVLTTIVQYATNPGALFSLLVSIPGVLIAITFHEFAHGFAAYKLGDNTAKNEGRLSLNPKDHLDPIGTLLLLFAGFGWGKPVHVNPNNYTRKRRSHCISSWTCYEHNPCLRICYNLLCHIQICRKCIFNVNSRWNCYAINTSYYFNKYRTRNI